MGQRNNNLPLDTSVFVKGLFVILVLGLSLLIQLYTKSLIPIIFIVPGIIWLAWGSWIVYRSMTSRNWPVTRGTIAENSIGEIEEPDRWYNTPYSLPVIAYRYSVDGDEYFSRRIALFQSDLKIPYNMAKTEHFCAQFPLNSVVDVHYNPRSPKDAVIVMGLLSRSKQHAIIFLIVGVAFLSLGALLILIGA